MNLYCASCDAPHDVDLAPDVGICVICGGPLIEDEIERETVGSLNKAIVTCVTDGLAGVAIAKGKADRGRN